MCATKGPKRFQGVSETFPEASKNFRRLRMHFRDVSGISRTTGALHMGPEGVSVAFQNVLEDFEGVS